MWSFLFENDIYLHKKKSTAVKHTGSTPTAIARLVNRENAHTALSVECVEQYGYSLMKRLLWGLRKKEIYIYKGVGGIGVFFTLLVTWIFRFEFVGFCIEFSSWRWLI